MSLVALVGSATLLLRPETLERILKPLVAFAAGSLLGGAFFHMLPAATEEGLSTADASLWMMVGFTLFLALEQFLHWHHCHRATAASKKPLTYLILLGDGLHNFLGGLGVAGVFLRDDRRHRARSFRGRELYLYRRLGPGSRGQQTSQRLGQPRQFLLLCRRARAALGDSARARIVGPTGSKRAPPP